MPRPQPGDVYRQHGSAIERLLGILGEEVRRHAEFAEAEGVDWGHVGDLSHVRQGLVGLLVQLAQRDRAAIERQLAERPHEEDRHADHGGH